MKKIMLACAIFACASLLAQEYKVVTTIESIVPGGIGRSRIIENNEQVNSEALSTERNEGNDGGRQRGVRRKDVKIDNFVETKLVNFYSGVGINFRNVASNDAVITDKINQLAKDGWVLAFVSSGVESNAGKDDGDGIFVTRYIFKR